MRNIVPKIISLSQYLDIQHNNPNLLRPSCCPHCGDEVLWGHGCYERKANRKNVINIFDPILIHRYFCPRCHRTCSTIPECLPHNKWYLWDIQQIVLIFFLIGKSFAAIAKKTMLPRHTVSRWINYFKTHLQKHKKLLYEQFSDLDISKSFSAFWLACLSKISLAQAMSYCYFAELKSKEKIQL